MTPISTPDAIAEIKLAAADGRSIGFACLNPHWNMGYTTEDKKFYWEYFCGCGIPDCTSDGHDAFDSIEELAKRAEGFGEWQRMQQLT